MFDEVAATLKVLPQPIEEEIIEHYMVFPSAQSNKRTSNTDHAAKRRK
jgi:hypothetical protein